jgi:hypothetical protein
MIRSMTPVAKIVDLTLSAIVMLLFLALVRVSE